MPWKSRPAVPIEVRPDGEIVINVASDAGKVDWIRAARLARRAEAGNAQAAQELAVLHATPTVQTWWEPDAADSLQSTHPVDPSSRLRPRPSAPQVLPAERESP